MIYLCWYLFGCLSGAILIALAEIASYDRREDK